MVFISKSVVKLSKSHQNCFLCTFKGLKIHSKLNFTSKTRNKKIKKIKNSTNNNNSITTYKSKYKHN